MSAKSLFDKVWDLHIVSQQPGHPPVLAIDVTLLHEVTSAQAFATLAKRNIPVLHPTHCFATLDHSIPTSIDRDVISDPDAKAQVNMLRMNAQKHRIPMFDFGSRHQGIVHVIGPELGITQPGLTVVCGDSHTSTHGAFGALAFGIGTSTLAHVLATSCMLMNKPKTMLVEFTGKLQHGVYAKDAIMKLIADIGIGGATGHVIEYGGDGITHLSMEERMTICNMSIECGAVAGMIAPDDVTFAYIEQKPYAPKGEQFIAAKEFWRTLQSDSDAHYDKKMSIDLNQLKPMITWGTNPGQAIAIDEQIPLLATLAPAIETMSQQALAYVQLQEGQSLLNTPINVAFIGSCTNGRIEDLRIAAQILKEKKVAANVTLYIVPGSEAVREQACAEGLDQIFVAAGAQFRMPGCSMCIGMNADKVPSGQRAISSTNRNFVGRQGPGSITHLASPATVAASALAGKIVSPCNYI